MRYAVIPPEYLPGQATAALLACVDLVVLADTFQYVRQSLQNRACLRTPDGTQWITVPVGGGQYGRTVRDVVVADDGRWRAKHAKAFRFNYGAAPYYEHYMPGISRLWTGEGMRLVDVTVPATRLVASVVHPGLRVTCASDLPGTPSSPAGIAARVGEGTLVVPDSSWEHDGTAAPSVARFRFDGPVYRQQFDGFEPGCSAIDLILLHGPGARGILLEGGRIEAAP